MTRSREYADEAITPSGAGDYTCPHCGDKLSYPPETYDYCPAVDGKLLGQVPEAPLNV